MFLYSMLNISHGALKFEGQLIAAHHVAIEIPPPHTMQMMTRSVFNSKINASCSLDTLYRSKSFVIKDYIDALCCLFTMRCTYHAAPEED